MKISIPERATSVDTPTGPVLVRSYQIVVDIRLVVRDTPSQLFPAVLNTGHSHNLSITETQLREWAQVSLERRRTIRVNGRPVPAAAADVEFGGMRLTLPEGIAVFPDNHPGATRLPLLSLRALVRNGIRVIIDGDRQQVSIYKPWRLWKW